MHKVASNSCMNTLAIFKALGKAKKIFANIVPKPSPNSGYTRTGGDTSPSKKIVRNLEK